MILSTRDLLARYARMLTKYGPGSPEELAFVSENAYNLEFKDLARVAKSLKEKIDSALGKTK